MGSSDLPVAGLVGAPAREALARLGPPETDRRVGTDRWLVFRSGDVTLRVRCRAARSPAEPRAVPDASPSPSGDARIASWTASFGRGRGSLREAAEPLGLWPAAAPDVRPGEVGPRVRRPLRDPSGVLRSLTAEVRAGRIRRLTVWDEPPEWLDGGGLAPGERAAPTGAGHRGEGET